MDSNSPNHGRASRPIYSMPNLTPTFVENPTPRFCPEAPKVDLTPTFVKDPPQRFRDRSTGSDKPIACVPPTRSQLQTLDSDTLVELLTTIHAILDERDEV